MKIMLGATIAPEHVTGLQTNLRQLMYIALAEM
jgi:hypothetical protein